MISAVLVTTDKTARADLYSKILHQLAAGAIYLPISFEANVAVLRRGIKSFAFGQQEFQIPTAQLPV